MYFKLSSRLVIISTILIIAFSNVAYMGEAPVDIVLSNEEFSYKLEAGDVAAQLIATDPDVGDVHTFEIVSGDYWFTLDGDKLLVVDNSRITANVRYPIGVKVTDSEGLSYEKTVYPTCRNLRPIAEPVSIELDEHTTKIGFFAATELESEPITFVVQTNPSKGSVQLIDATTGEFKYTPFADQVGTDSFTYYATDGATWSDFTTVSITILEVNDIPVCEDLVLDVTEDTARNSQLIGNDSDGDSLTYEIVIEPTKGTLSNFNAGTGTFKYLPMADYNGSDSFTYKANDGTDDSDTKTVTLNINSVNDAPVANDGTLMTNENASNNGTLSGIDIDGDTISYSIVDQGSKGTVTLTDASTGAYTYTPNPNVFGTDSFTYKVNDGVTDSNVGTIEVKVNSTNVAPVANDGILEVTEDTPATGTLTGTDVDGDALNYSVVNQGSKGTVVVNNASTGVYTYTPDVDANGSDSFTFKISDGAEDSVLATINVTIVSVNDAPTTTDGTLSVKQGEIANGKLMATDVDGDGLTFEVVSQGSKGKFEITDATTGDFTYDPNKDELGNDTFTFKVTDGELESNISSMQVDILYNSYTVDFQSNGGSLVDSVTQEYNSLVAKPTTPTREDYDFMGWYKEPECINQWNFDVDTVPARDIVLYAKWKIKQDSIGLTANPNNVEFDNSFNKTFTLDIYNDTVSNTVYKSDISLSGVFSNLNIDNISNTPSTVTASVYGNLDNSGLGLITLDEDVLNLRTNPLTASVTVNPKPTYRVTYDGNGATLGTTPIDNVNYESSETVNIADNSNGLEKTGYNFIGWNTSSTGSGDTYIPGDIMTIGNEDITLYAMWKLNEYIVTFKNYDDSIFKTQKVKYENKAIIPSNPTRSGYTFKGWYKDKELTKAFDFNSKITKDLIVYPKWQRIDRDDDDNNSGSGFSSNKSSDENEVAVIVDGEKETCGEEQVKEVNGEKNVDIVIDSKILSKKIEERVNEKIKNNNDTKNSLVEIPIKTKNPNKITTRLTGDIVKKMEKDDFKLSIKSDDINYIMPAKEVGIDSVAEKLEVPKDSLEKIEVEVRINKVDQALNEEIKESAKKNNYEVISSPVNFDVVAKVKTTSEKEREVKVSKFKQYVQRVIRAPEGIALNKITTGVLYNEDGTFSHIPTEIFIKDGGYYAKLNSLTNSSYSVIWNPITVSSVEGHWSKEDVNDMASRLVIKNPKAFKPDENITRGEFAEYITKALGIYKTGAAKERGFTDVKVTDELADAITIATDYNIISGYPDGSFKPKAKISREEAMVMYARAMDIVKLKEKDNNRIDNYTDQKEVSDWAYNYVKKTISMGIFNGRTNKTIAPKGTFTYAEAATAISNLLKEGNLINNGLIK